MQVRPTWVDFMLELADHPFARLMTLFALLLVLGIVLLGGDLG